MNSPVGVGQGKTNSEGKVNRREADGGTRSSEGLHKGWEKKAVPYDAGGKAAIMKMKLRR